MGVSHIALAVKDIEATHRFYTEAMGFDLVKVEIIPQKGGFARHVFYSTGSNVDQLIAFWDLSSVPGCENIRTDISRDLGLDALTNHIAFQADDLDDIERRKQRWLRCGKEVIEIDHGWIHSVYTEDPDGIMVEFAVVTRPFTETDATEALELLRGDSPPLSSDEPHVSFHKPTAKD